MEVLKLIYFGIVKSNVYEVRSIQILIKEVSVPS